MRLEKLSQTDRAMEVVRFLREYPQGATLDTLTMQTHCTRYEIHALMVYWGQRGAIERIITDNHSIYRLK